VVKTDLVVVLGDRYYSVERPWGELPEGRKLAGLSNVAVDSRSRVYAYQRESPPVAVFNPDGSYDRSWGAEHLSDAHGIFIDRDDRVWLIDRDAHVIMAFDTEGRLLQTIGERHRPHLQQPFNHPADIAIASNGDIYVADGYANSAVHHFSPEGELIRSWGKPGTEPGEFTTPHAIWVDERNRVLVADRENNRVQVFSADGGFLDQWGDLYHPMDIWVDRRGMVFVTDQIPRLSMYDGDGRLIGRCRPVLNGAHGVWGDAQGNIYLAEQVPEARLTRLTPMD
jgi:peptidylglycine monooxygenase